MIADFFTKPLQGALFVRMHENILNLPTRKIANVNRSVLKDWRSMNPINVGENKNDKGGRNKTGTQD